MLQQQQRGNSTPTTLRRSNRPAAATLSVLRGRVTCLVWILLVIYLSFLFTFFSAMEEHNQNKQQNNYSEPKNAVADVGNGKIIQSPVVVNKQAADPALPRNRPASYADWRKLAVDLAQLTPSETLARLEQDDPFGVRAVETFLANVSPEEPVEDVLEGIGKIFSCPAQAQRLGFPDRRNVTKAQAFRQATRGYFVFFQHLRKAGGTNVCTLATANIPKPNLPSYFCMPGK